MVNGRLIYTICRKLFYTIGHLCITNLHYHRRQAWNRGPYPYNGYPIFTHQQIGIWTSVNNYISCATYPVCRREKSSSKHSSWRNGHTHISHVTYGIHHTWHEHISQSYGRCRSERTSLTQARLWVSSTFYITVSRMEWGPGGTHTQLEIYFAANTTRIDLTSHHNFTCSIPPWFINIETATYNEYGARRSIPGATLWRTIEATGAT